MYLNLRSIAIKGVLHIFLGVGICGCVSTPVSFHNPTQGSYEVLGTSQGRAGGVLLFNVIPIGHGSRVERAANNAVEKLGGDGIMEVTVKDKWWWAGLVFGNVATVEGKVFRYIERDNMAAGKAATSAGHGQGCTGIGGVWKENTCVFGAE